MIMGIHMEWETEEAMGGNNTTDDRAALKMSYTPIVVKVMAIKMKMGMTVQRNGCTWRRIQWTWSDMTRKQKHHFKGMQNNLFFPDLKWIVEDTVRYTMTHAKRCDLNAFLSFHIDTYILVFFGGLGVSTNWGWRSRKGIAQEEKGQEEEVHEDALSEEEDNREITKNWERPKSVRMNKTSIHAERTHTSWKRKRALSRISQETIGNGTLT
jgi:hypothetical protein